MTGRGGGRGLRRAGRGAGAGGEFWGGGVVGAGVDGVSAGWGVIQSLVREVELVDFGGVGEVVFAEPPTGVGGVAW